MNIELNTPIARRDDPASSHESADAITNSGNRLKQALAVLELVRLYPGRSSRELALLGELDRYVVARRLPELEAARKVFRMGFKRCSEGRCRAIAWYASEEWTVANVD